MKNNLTINICSAGVVLIAAIVLSVWPFTPRRTLSFLSVGQGDATLIQCGRDEALIDGGPDRTVLSKISRYVFLFDREISTAILTHPHADHLSGLLAVARRYRIRQLILPPNINDETTRTLAQMVLRRGGRVIEAQRGDTWWVGNCGYLRVVWPPPNFRTKDGNDGSLVLQYFAQPKPWHTAGRSVPVVLLAADATSVVEGQLLSSAASLMMPILKVGHHGSRQATSGPWLEAVRPSLAVISVGKNSYGHPAPELLRRLEVRDIVVWRTDALGDYSVSY